MLYKSHYKIIDSYPKEGDIIYVPSYSFDKNKSISLENCNKEGGAATVKRVIIDHEGNHYITVEEFSGYFEMKWEGDLKNKQQDLAYKYGYSRAYIKPIE